MWEPRLDIHTLTPPGKSGPDYWSRLLVPFVHREKVIICLCISLFRLRQPGFFISITNSRMDSWIISKNKSEWKKNLSTKKEFFLESVWCRGEFSIVIIISSFIIQFTKYLYLRYIFSTRTLSLSWVLHAE